MKFIETFTLKILIKLEILDCHKMVNMDDSILERLLKEDSGDNYEDQY